MKLLVIVAAIFILGLYFVTGGSTHEGFDAKNKLQYRCPNVLIQKGNTYYLYNSQLAKVPGVNPIVFNNLEDYTEFIDWQRSQGIRCPVLYLQESYDAQGNPVYKARPSPTNMQGGLPDLMPMGKVLPPQTKLYDAGRDDPPYNQNSFPAFDAKDQYIGLDTPLDKMFHEANGQVSASPMDTTWGGRAYTQSLVDAGFYSVDEVSKSRV
jgi:hypothetical protein